MTRVTRSVARKKRLKKWLKAAKGYFGAKKNHHRQTRNVVMKAWTYAYRDRKQKKREFRALWTQRINAAVRCHGMSYSRFIDGLTKAKVEINRKMLSHMAIEEPKAFEEIVNQAKKGLS